MEKCVDSEYPKTQHDSSKSPETWTNLLSSNSRNNEQKNTSKKPVKIPRTRKKIAAEKRSVGRSDPGRRITNAKREKSVREENQRVTQLNVLKSRYTPARRSVQNNTKILHRNVPDRIGKYVNSSVRSETKLLIGDCLPVANSSNNCLSENGTDSGGASDVGLLLKDCPDTKLNMIGNECLSNEESVALGNSIESDLGSKNIFEKIFDDCLVSTSVVNDASSQETLNLETDDESVAINPKTVEKYTRLLENFENFKKDDARMIDNENTPLKKERLQQSPSAPVKMKDHSKYYSRKKIRHVCGYCHKIFKSNGKLNSHVYSHTGERPFDCNNCGKAFSSKFKLVRHLLIHSEIRKFICQICDRTFLRNDHLKNHYKIHDPQKKMYKCPKENCDKEYSSLMSHKKHMAYHNVEDGDLKCLICSVKFESKEEILFHLKSHSGSRLFKSQSDKKFKCDFCDRPFLTRKDVTRHLVVHTGERDFLCQFCPQRFGRKDHLVRHIKKSHLKEGMKTEMKHLIEDKKTEDVKQVPVAEESPPVQSSDPKEDKEEEEEPGDEEPNEKTHIVITVKNPVQKKRSSDSGNKTKSFRKSDSSVPNKKQVPLSKNKSSTTQIFLQNIPNVFIIPNNSIILLRNQSGSSSKGKKAAEASESSNNSGISSSTSSGSSSSSNSTNNNNTNVNNNSSDSASATPVSQDRYQFSEEFLSGPRPMPNPTSDDAIAPIESDCTFNLNYNYMFQPPQYPTNYSYNDNFGNYQPEVTSYGQQFDNMNFDMLPPNELKRTEATNVVPDESLLGSSTSPGKILEGVHGDLQRKIGIVKPMTKTLMGNQCMMDKDIFEESTENLIINDTILSEFKVDESVILENDGGILNNIFGQSGVDSTGNELLRNLLMSENPILSPLPGFSQIFHNSNAN